jgi:hypothetical protein
MDHPGPFAQFPFLIPPGKAEARRRNINFLNAGWGDRDFAGKSRLGATAHRRQIGLSASATGDRLSSGFDFSPVYLIVEDPW